MRSNSFSPLQEDDGSQAERWQWHGSPQYAPTPGNFGTPSSPSHFSFIDTSPATPTEVPPPQSNPSRTDKLPLLQYRDWVEGKAYDENPPTCIHYWIEWKVTLNNRTVVKDIKQDLVLAPGFYWRLFLQLKLREKLCLKYPHKKITLDDTSIVVSVTRLPDKLTRQFDKTDIDWPAIENQLLEWGHHFLAGKRMKLIISFSYTDESPGTTISRRSTDKRGTHSATQAMLQELDREVNAEEDLTGEPAAWRHVYETVNNLGILYNNQGKLKEAEEMYQRALAGCEKALGPDHTSTLDTVNNLGSLYSDLSRRNEAEEMYQRALAGYEKALGPGHSNTRMASKSLEALTSLGATRPRKRDTLLKILRRK